jgi:hypothetical protein
MRFARALAPLLLLLVTSKAFSQDDSAVTAAFEQASQGVKAFEEGKPAEALEQFSRAYAIVRLPSLALYMARSHTKLGHYTQAASFYAAATQLDDGVGDHELQQKARSEAAQERQELLVRMPKLVVRTPGVLIQGIRFQVDGIATPPDELAQGKPMDPGLHLVIAVSGERRLEQAETLQDGSTKTMVFDFEPAPPHPPIAAKEQPIEPSGAALHTATWVSFGIAGAALAVSGTTAIWALVDKRDLDKNGTWRVGDCENASSASKCNEYGHLRTVSTIGFYTGLVGAATGAVLLLATPTSKSVQKAARATPYLGLGVVGVQGQF